MFTMMALRDWLNIMMMQQDLHSQFTHWDFIQIQDYRLEASFMGFAMEGFTFHCQEDAYVSWKVNNIDL